MKKLLLILAILAALMAGGIGLIQWGINRKLAQSLPQARRSLGSPVDASALSISLWRGALDVRGLRIGNPGGFAESNRFSLAEGRIALRYLPLFRRQLRFGEIRLRDAALTVVRSADGNLNVKRAGDDGEGRVPGGNGEPTGPEDQPPASRGKLPAMGLDRLAAGVAVRYVDYGAATGGAPYEATLRLEIVSSNLATYGNSADESGWGTLSAVGAVESRGRRSPVQVSGRIAPVTDVGTLSFNLAGSIEGLDPELVRPFVGNFGVKGEAERLDIALVCAGGRFEEARSRLTLVLKNVKSGKRVLSELTVVIPVHGTVEKPKLRLEQALLGAMAQLLSAPREENAAEPAAGGEPKKRQKKSASPDVETIAKSLEALFKGNP